MLLPLLVEDVHARGSVSRGLESRNLEASEILTWVYQALAALAFYSTWTHISLLAALYVMTSYIIEFQDILWFFVNFNDLINILNMWIIATAILMMATAAVGGVLAFDAVAIPGAAMCFIATVAILSFYQTFINKKFLARARRAGNNAGVGKTPPKRVAMGLRSSINANKAMKAFSRLATTGKGTATITPAATPAQSEEPPPGMAPAIGYRTQAVSLPVAVPESAAQDEPVPTAAPKQTHPLPPSQLPPAPPMEQWTQHSSETTSALIAVIAELRASIEELRDEVRCGRQGRAGTTCAKNERRTGNSVSVVDGAGGSQSEG